MINVKALIEKGLADTTLEILVFGPAVEPPSTDARVKSLQDKRKEIRTLLAGDGHSVQFGEDIIDPSLPLHAANPMLQELVAMRAADVIVVLVHSPGAIAEAIHLLRDRTLCAKSLLFCFEEHKDGLVAKNLELARGLGARLVYMTLGEVTACMLATTIHSDVQSIHAAKAFLL